MASKVVNKLDTICWAKRIVVSNNAILLFQYSNHGVYAFSLKLMFECVLQEKTQCLKAWLKHYQGYLLLHEGNEKEWRKLKELM